MVAKQPQPPGEVRVVGGDRAAFARGHVFDRMKTEGVEQGQRADRPAAIAAAEGVAGVVDQGQAVLAGDRPKAS